MNVDNKKLADTLLLLVYNMAMTSKKPEFSLLDDGLMFEIENYLIAEKIINDNNWKVDYEH